MAKQDDWVRVTLRLPADLHQRMVASLGAASLNAAIVSALEEKYPPMRPIDELYSRILEWRRALQGYQPSHDAGPTAKMLLKDMGDLMKQLEHYGAKEVDLTDTPI